MVEYLDLPQEPPAVIESNRPPAYWPSSAKNDALIAVENVSVSYAPDLPSVLQDISFTLKAGERIGLLGTWMRSCQALATNPNSGRTGTTNARLSNGRLTDLDSRQRQIYARHEYFAIRGSFYLVVSAISDA